jgi:histidinol-phosphate aminotransferase
LPTTRAGRRGSLEYDNLVVLRTFSKAAGIAGLRLGYGICPAWLMDELWKFKQPYNVNVAATVAGLASLRDLAHLRATVEKLKAERQRLLTLLMTIPYLTPQPSEANFVLCSVIGREAKMVKLALEQQGILVRYYNKPGLDNCIRISVGLPRADESAGRGAACNRRAPGMIHGMQYNWSYRSRQNET